MNIATAVAIVGPSFVNPCDCFIEYAQATSNKPATIKTNHFTAPTPSQGRAVPVLKPKGGAGTSSPQPDDKEPPD